MMGNSPKKGVGNFFKKIVSSEKQDATSSAEEWIDKGNNLSAKGQHEKAITCFKKALQFDPDNADAWLNLGLSQDQSGKYQEAIPSYCQYLLTAPDLHIKVMFHTQQRLHALGIADIAAEIVKINTGYIRTSKANDGSNPFEAQNCFKKGRTLFVLGKYEQAISFFDRGLQLEPNNVDALHKKGRMLSIQGNYSAAMPCFEKVLDIDPFHANAWYEKGDCLQKLGRLEDASLCFDQALIIIPDAVLVWHKKGLAQEALGHKEEAILAFRKVLECANENFPNETKWSSQHLQALGAN